MKFFFIRFLKITGIAAATVPVIFGGFWIYFANQIGEPAPVRPVFADLTKRPLVFAHRGGGGLFPENTLEAFRYSHDMGVDVLELDVHGTADGQLVVFHDSKVDRTTDGTGKISQFTLAELKKLDAGFRFSKDGGATFPFRGKGVKIPTLDEIFEAFPQQTFNVEPKQAEPSIVGAMCETIRRRAMTDHVIVGSFRQEAIDEFRTACPEVATAATPSEAISFLTFYKTGLSGSYTPPMNALQIPRRLGWLNVVDRDFIAAAHKMNLQVHVWTINDAETMRQLTEAGADGIMTDYPDVLLDLLKTR